jgi:hypothetical protein
VVRSGLLTCTRPGLRQADTLGSEVKWEDLRRVMVINKPDIIEAEKLTSVM